MGIMGYAAFHYFVVKGFDTMKKQLSLVMALITLVTSLILPVTASAAFSDVADDYPYKRAITTLNKLNVIDGYENGTFEPEKSITRAEFTKIIVYTLGYGDFTEKTTQFEDAIDHWANANIKVAYDLGIINGFDDTTFKPDDPVTYEQALKMVVCTLGYQTAAEQKGGYPTGYQAEASVLGLTDGINDTTFTQSASRGVIAQIMYNALDVTMLDPVTLSSEQNRNLLNDYLNVYELKGTIVGVEDSTTSDCTVELYPGQMDIKADDDTEYVMNYTEYSDSYADMNALLGQTVIVYYRQDRNTDDKWLVELDNETYSNEEITLYSYDIDSFEGSTLRYYTENDSRSKSLKLDSTDLTVRYNGKAVTGDVTLGDETYTPVQALSMWLNPDSDYFIYGTAKLISNQKSGVYNIVDIYDYDTIVAYRTPTSSDYKITDKTITGNFLVLDPDSPDYKFTITKDGKQINTTSISANDVLNYAVSLDGELYTVYDTKESITGTITALSSDTSDNYISIDNKEYRVSDRFFSYIENKEQQELKTGMNITAYTDSLGTIEWGELKADTTLYPYAYAINYSSEGETYYLRMFAPSSATITSFSSSTSYKVRSVKIADNVKLNGKKSSGENVIVALSENAKNANPDSEIPNINTKPTDISQLIKISFNDAGELDQVITFDPAKDGTQSQDNSLLIRYKEMNPEQKYYVSSSSVKESNTGATLYSIRTSTPMFVIPKDRSDYEDYSLKSAITSASMSSGGSYYLDAYDVDNTRYPGCLIVYNTTFKSGTPISKTTSYRLVADDIIEEYNEDEGDVFFTMSTYNSATTLTDTLISPEADFSGVGKGDIILYGTDSDKYADSYMLVEDYDEIKRVLNGDPITYTDENGEERTETYTWAETCEQTKENNWQKYVFDWRYPKTGISEPSDEYYQTGGNSTDIFSRAAMYNVLQILPDDNILYVTRNGFDENGNINDSLYQEIKVSSSTKIVRYDSNEDEFTPYAEGTESTALTVNDLKEANNFGMDCSKVLITYVSSTTSSSSVTPTAKFIVIYD